MSSRWAQYDEDDYRLPEGMRRIGYDADTETYTYQDTDGSIWEGPPGARYGKLTQIARPDPPRSRTPTPPPLPPRVKANSPRVTRRFSLFGRADHNEDPPVARNEDWRMLAPFLLIRRSLTSSKKKKRQSAYEKGSTNKEQETKTHLARRTTI